MLGCLNGGRLSIAYWRTDLLFFWNNVNNLRKPSFTQSPQTYIRKSILQYWLSRILFHTLNAFWTKRACVWASWVCGIPLYSISCVLKAVLPSQVNKRRLSLIWLGFFFSLFKQVIIYSHRWAIGAFQQRWWQDIKQVVCNEVVVKHNPWCPLQTCHYS